MKIRSTLTLQFTFLVSGILLVSFISLYLFFQKRIEESFHNRLKEKATTSAILLLKVEEVDSSVLKAIDLSRSDILHGENISIYDESGKEIYTSNDTVNFLTANSMIRDVTRKSPQIFRQSNYDIIGISYSNIGKTYTVLAGAINVEGHARLNDLGTLMAGLFILMIGIVATSGWIYSGRALKPINEVMIGVQHISTQDLSKRLPGGEKPDEIGALITIFNNLLIKIDNAFTLQKTFVANVSHELKNPLTKITSQLEVTLLNQRKPEEYVRILYSVLEDVRELNQMSTSLLDLASVNQENAVFQKTSLRLDEILWEVRESVLTLNANYKVDIHTITMPEEESKLYLLANPYLLKTALQNIIENACKFSNDHQATISLICTNEELEIRVFDNGPGIDKKEIQNIFQPFYRSNNTSKIKGHGIGLSLSQRIIAIHQGTIEIDSSLGEGTQVSVIFPVA